MRTAKQRLVFLALFCHFIAWNAGGLGESLFAPLYASQRLEIGPAHIAHEGEYRNLEYGYSFTIPVGLIAYSDPAPAPQHGVAIPLDNSHQNYIWLDGSYNAKDFDSISTLRQYSFQLLLKEHGLGLEVLPTKAEKLDGLEATDLSVRYVSKQTNLRVFEDQILAIRPNGKVIYTIGLISNMKEYANHLSILVGLLKTWKLRPGQ